MTERFITNGTVELWTEEFGDPAHPPVLLVPGSMASGITWPDALVGRLAAGGRRVIRYDHRDTGRSSTLDFDAAPYTWTDLKDDLLAVVDGYGLDAVHLVGHSAGGVLAQWVAAEHPERVLTLTTVGSSPLGAGEGRTIMNALTGQAPGPDDLPFPREEFVEFFTGAAVNPPAPDRKSLIDFAVATARVLHGTALPFDEDAERALAEKIFDRARRPGSETNHQRAFAADPTFEPVDVLGRITAPTLAIEGTEEPAKPGHSALIADRVQRGELFMVEGMGHMFPAPVHGAVAEAILRHTAR
ncbi:alpha/beta fold hydrolase [Actinomadura kijaniata]|uniref:alpha/beta fold hydrolase n=1 Tax=Actinomadura kijaniata TaxID=46161 RepID=UPI001FE104E2|nr:alpha/beta fold hydrolase [Actinomadura kijaniata]